jgi:SRSO17 transposase
VFDPRAWGLSPSAITGLGQQVYEFWERYADCFQTTTRDTSAYALDSLSGVLRMTEERNFTSMGRVSGESPQNIQPIISHSPWEAQDVWRQVREEICQTPAFHRGGAVILDERADERASGKTVGAGGQHNGRLGQVEMSQVGTFLAYANDGIWTWIDGQLFLPESWFARGTAKERARLGVPANRTFASKIELGGRMIQRVKAEGVPFELVCCDTLYGRSQWRRRQMAAAGLIYRADVPGDTRVYLTPPVVGLPQTPDGQPKQRCRRPRVISQEKPVQGRQVAARSDTVWRPVRGRASERGQINDPFSARRVWTTDGHHQPVQEWLVRRRAEDGTVAFALSNAPADTPLERLAWGKCQRQFIECSNQDAKSEAGWDELRAQKYPAWEHHLALTILATWFVAQTKLDWRQQYPRRDELKQELGVSELPALSTANIRELVRAVMPLPQLTVQGATRLVVERLVNRARSRKSRMQAMGHQHSPP